MIPAFVTECDDFFLFWYTPPKHKLAEMDKSEINPCPAEPGYTPPLQTV